MVMQFVLEMKAAAPSIMADAQRSDLKPEPYCTRVKSHRYSLSGPHAAPETRAAMTDLRLSDHNKIKLAIIHKQTHTLLCCLLLLVDSFEREHVRAAMALAAGFYPPPLGPFAVQSPRKSVLRFEPLAKNKQRNDLHNLEENRDKQQHH
jgi:hypothetical protein